MALDYDFLRLALQVLQLVGLVALGVYTHISSKSKANAGAINALRKDTEETYKSLEDRLSRCERRSDVFETHLSGAPTHQDLSKMYDRLNDVAEDLSGVSGQMTALSHQLSMVNQYLLNNKGGQGQ